MSLPSVTTLMVCRCGMRFRAADPKSGRRCICGAELVMHQQTRADFIKNHGRPAHFGAAALAEFNQGRASAEAVNAAIARYKLEWELCV